MSGSLRPTFAHLFARLRELESRVHDLDGKTAVGDEKRRKPVNGKPGAPESEHESPRGEGVADAH